MTNYQSAVLLLLTMLLMAILFMGSVTYAVVLELRRTNQFLKAGADRVGIEIGEPNDSRVQ